MIGLQIQLLNTNMILINIGQKYKIFSKDSWRYKICLGKISFYFFNDVIRYDYNFNDDQSEFIFNKIEDFIDKNPINQGPNYNVVKK